MLCLGTWHNLSLHYQTEATISHSYDANHLQTPLLLGIQLLCLELVECSELKLSLIIGGKYFLLASLGGPLIVSICFG
jgi:hypothetical protein